VRRPGPTPVSLSELAPALGGAELLSRSFQDRFSSITLERTPSPGEFQGQMQALHSSVANVPTVRVTAEPTKEVHGFDA